MKEFSYVITDAQGIHARPAAYHCVKHHKKVAAQNAYPF